MKHRFKIGAAERFHASDIQTVRITGFCQQLFGFFRIIFIGDMIFRIAEHVRGGQRGCGLCQPISSNGDDVLSVNRMGNGLPERLIIERFHFRVEDQVGHVVGRLGISGILSALADLLPVGGRNIHRVNLARLKCGDSSGIIRNQFKIQRFDRGLSVPVVRISFQGDAHILDRFLHSISAGSAGVKAQKALLILIGFRKGFADNADGCDLLHQRGELIFQVEFHRGIVRSRDGVDGLHFLLHICIVKTSFIGINHIACLQRISVMEGHAVTQRKRPGEAVFADVVLRCEHGNFFSFVVDPVKRLIDLTA